jgi:hypothetical protein
MNVIDSRLPNPRRRLLLSQGVALVALQPLWAAAQNRPVIPLSATINRSGKLRALSQRASKAYVQATLGVLADRAREILLATQRLAASSADELASASPQPEIRKLAGVVQHDVAALGVFVDAGPRKDGVIDVAHAADSLLESADRLTKAYEGLSQQGSAKIVNIAGRQRMLSQRAARAFFLVAAGHDTPAVRKQLEVARAEFVQGLATLQGAPISTPSIRNELDLAKSQWLFYDAALGKAANPDTLQAVATTSERIFEVMDNLTSMYDSAVRDLL